MQLPNPEKLGYVKLLAEVLLLLLLVPLVFFGIVRDPHHAADKALGRPV